MNWRSDRLKMLGLNDSEVKILESIPEAKSVQDIASHTGLSRTGINYAIAQLIDKGFVETVRIGKRFLYVSITSAQLVKKMQDISDSVATDYRKGVRVKTSREDEFIIHVGVNEIVPAYTRIASMNKNERIRGVQHHRSWMALIDKISKEQLVDFNRAIIKNHLILDGMLNESAYESYRKEVMRDPEKHREAVESLDGRMADYTVFPDEYFNYDSEIWIFKSTTLIINWKEEVAIEITNENMTSFLRDMFELVKRGGRKIDHNKFMRELVG